MHWSCGLEFAANDLATYAFQADLNTGLVAFAKVEGNVQYWKRFNAEPRLFAQPLVSSIRRERGLKDDVVAKS
jgi:hypothetical protein